MTRHNRHNGLLSAHACYGLDTGKSPTCCRFATDLSFILQTYYGLVSDTMGKSPTCYRLATGKVSSLWDKKFTVVVDKTSGYIYVIMEKCSFLLCICCCFVCVFNRSLQTMTSYSQLIEKVQSLCHVFEEELANSCRQSSDQPTNQATIAIPSPQSVIECLNSRDVNTNETIETGLKQLNVSSRRRVPTLVQKKPLRSKSDRQLQKKYKYVNKKFIVCKETSRKDERDVDAFGKQSTVNDPFEFVGTQLTPTSDADVDDKTRNQSVELGLFEDTLVDESREMPPVTEMPPAMATAKYASVQQKCTRPQHGPSVNRWKKFAEDIADAETSVEIVLFEEASVDESSEMKPATEMQPATAADKCGSVQQKCTRRQHGLSVNELKQLAEDIADAEMYSLIISQQKQTKHMVSGDNVDEPTTGIYRTEIADDAAMSDPHEMFCSNISGETAAGVETGLNVVCMAEGHPADSDFVGDGRNAKNYDNEGEHAALMGDECHSRTVSQLNMSVTLSVETDQLSQLSAPAPSTCIDSDNTEIYETCFGRSADSCDTANQMRASHSIPCSTDAAVVDISSDGTSQTVTSISSDVNTTAGLQHGGTSCSVASTVSNLSLSNAFHPDGHSTTVAEYSEPSTASMPADDFNRTDVKRSYKRRCKTQRKKNKNSCYGGSALKKMKNKAGNLIALDAGHDSSG